MSDKKKHSIEQEEMVAKYLGWSRVKGSGARPNYPGDVISDEWMGECKTHVEPVKKVILDFGVYDKIDKEANSRYKNSVLFSDDGIHTPEHTLCMVIDKSFPVEEAKALVEDEFEDYSDSTTVRIEIDNFERFKVITRNNQYYLIMDLPAFKEFIDA